ncbi:MAG: hypothetical protein IPM39_24640 [Chloroflexi bacterium]|nr:hypothetical protein [Chloroflexota bacterium]
MIAGAGKRRLTAPRATAVAGILFALLFTSSVVLVRTAMPGDLSGGIDWVEQGERQIATALSLMPFAGIAFLWFIGVIRDRLSEVEEHFFSTVFLGSGLLFLAMVFVSMAIVGGILSSVNAKSDELLQPDIIIFGRAIMLQISNVYALRMAGVLMTSLGTVWLRGHLMPRWLVVVTYLLALLLLLITSLSVWVALIFPGWVLFISIFILVVDLRKPTG